MLSARQLAQEPVEVNADHLEQLEQINYTLQNLITIEKTKKKKKVGPRGKDEARVFKQWVGDEMDRTNQQNFNTLNYEPTNLVVPASGLPSAQPQTAMTSRSQNSSRAENKQKKQPSYYQMPLQMPPKPKPPSKVQILDQQIH